MASAEQVNRDAGIGTGPEYEYPKTMGDEPVPIKEGNLEPSEEAAGAKPVVGETAQDLSDKEIAEEERLESAQAGEWKESMAQNTLQPGEKPDPPEEFHPSDRGY